MQTPGHAVINLTLIGAFAGPDFTAPILLGAILPDLPIALLYAREHYLHGVPEEVIWSNHYQRPFWQNLIHGMHSFPLGTAGFALSLAVGSPGWALFFASVLLHALGDFPIHVHDAHRHFWPVSQYRFISPVSYWDLRYHAREVAALEMLAVIAAGTWLWLHRPGSLAHLALLAVGIWYAGTYVLLWIDKSASPIRKKS